MIGRALVLSTLIASGLAASACSQVSKPAMCAVAAHTADTVLAYPDGMACVGSGAGHVIVVDIPCGVLLATTAEDDVCVRTSHTGRIIPLSSFDKDRDIGYSLVDAS